MRPPIECFISCTTKCNLKCPHCYSNSITYGKDIDFNKAANLANITKPLRIVVSGGEPLLIVDKLVNFFKKLKNKPYIVLATNGTTLNDKNFKKIKPYVSKLQISLDSLKREKYFEIRGVDSLDLVIRNIKRFNDKIEIQIAFDLFKSNVDEIRDIVKFCIKENIKTLNILRPRPSGRFTKVSKLSLSPAGIKKAYKKLIRLEKETNLRIIIHDPLINILENKSSKCIAAKEIIAIDVEGNLKPCPFFIESVKGEPLKVWEKSKLFKMVRNSKISDCKRCEFEKLCGGGCKACSWNLYKEFKKDPWCFAP